VIRTIGIANHFINNGFTKEGSALTSGICHVGPWLCMQETVAKSITQALIENKRAQLTGMEKIIPYVDLAFTENPESTMKQKLASFIYDCHRYYDLRNIY